MEEGDDLPRTGTQSGLCGCLAAAAFAFPVGAFFLAAMAMGDCYPNEACHADDGPMVLAGFAIIASLAAALGLAVRALVDWARRRRLDPASAGRPPFWPILVILPLLWLAARMARELGFFGLY